MRAFELALNTDENAGLSDGVPSPSILASPQVGAYGAPGQRVRKVSALSDFAPVNQRVRRYVTLPLLSRQTSLIDHIRRHRKKMGNGKKLNTKGQEWMFLILRWPLLVSPMIYAASSFFDTDDLLTGYNISIYHLRVRHVCVNSPARQYEGVADSM